MSRIKLAISLCIVFIASATAQHAAAQTSCTDLSLQGGYGFTATGSDVTPQGTFLASAVGQLLFDGSGHVTGKFTTSENGTLVSLTGTGSYMVSTDCSGMISLSFGASGSSSDFTVNIVLDDTNEIRGIVTTPGAVQTLIGRKQV
jgi:hypothetical protein